MRLDKEKLLEQLDIRDFYHKLLPPFSDSGREWITTRCVFHSDRSPSLSVNLKNGGFVCHAGSCGKRGDLFAFFMELRGVDFRTALENIAEIYGVPKQ